MSRCKACNVILDEFELTATDTTGAHYDLCRECLKVSKKTELGEDFDSSGTILHDLDLYYLE